MFECRFDYRRAFFWDVYALNVHEAIKHSFKVPGRTRRLSLPWTADSKVVDRPLQRIKLRRLGVIVRRLQPFCETEKLASEQRFYHPRRDTKFLSLCGKLGTWDGLFGENYETVYDCTTNDVVGLEEISDEIFLVSNTIGKLNCNQVLQVFIFYW